MNGKRGAWGHAHRRHGRDHAGDGEVGASARRGDPHERARGAALDRERQGARRRARDRRGDRRARGRRRRAAQAALSRSRRRGRGCAGAARPLRCDQVGLGHVPHERGAGRASRFHLPARKGRRRTTTAPASSSARRSPTWSAPISTRAATAGRRSRSSRCSSPRRSMPRSRPRASTWRACSCSTWRRTCRQGRSWEDEREKEAFADLVIDTVTRHAPNFKAAVLGRQILSPLDLERRFGMVDGDIFHGALSLDQLFSMRPQLGYADYRMPLPGLYLCASGAHPGGGVTGAPGSQRGRRDHPRPQGLDARLDEGGGHAVRSDDPHPAHVRRGGGTRLLRELPRLLRWLGAPVRPGVSALYASLPRRLRAAPLRAPRGLLARAPSCASLSATSTRCMRGD